MEKLNRDFPELIGLPEGEGVRHPIVGGYAVEIGREPREIQVLTGMDGVHFEGCYELKIEIGDAGRKIP